MDNGIQVEWMSDAVEYIGAFIEEKKWQNIIIIFIIH